MIFFKKTIGIALPALCLAATTVRAQSAKAIADKIVAVIGDRIILQSEIKNTIDDMRRQQMQIPVNAECLVAEQAIVSRLLVLQAEKDSIHISDDELENEINHRLRQWTSHYGPDALPPITNDMREALQERMLASVMHQRIIGSVSITPAEVKDYFEKIPAADLPLVESELEIGQIVSYPKPSAEMEKYIAGEMTNYRNQVVHKTTSFERLANRVSEDDKTKSYGGYMEVDRNDKTWEPSVMARIFRLKPGEVSTPVRSTQGYFIFEMLARNGDQAVIRLILRRVPVSDSEIDSAIYKMKTLRSDIISQELSFNEAALKCNEDKFGGHLLISEDGDSYFKMSELDQKTAGIVANLEVGDFSNPYVFTQNGRKGIRLLYLKSKTQPHRMNLRDDYSKISQAALEEKRNEVLNKWVQSKIANYPITLSDEIITDCPSIEKLARK